MNAGEIGTSREIGTFREIGISCEAARGDALLIGGRSDRESADLDPASFEIDREDVELSGDVGFGCRELGDTSHEVGTSHGDAFDGIDIDIREEWSFGFSNKGLTDDRDFDDILEFGEKWWFHGSFCG